MSMKQPQSSIPFFSLQEREAIVPCLRDSVLRIAFVSAALERGGILDLKPADRPREAEAVAIRIYDQTPKTYAALTGALRDAATAIRALNYMPRRESQ